MNDQRDAQILFYVFISIYNSLHVSSTQCSSSGETNCFSTASGNSHSENRCFRLLYVNIANAYLFQYACLIIPDGCIVLIQFCFEFLIFIYFCCLFCIAKFYILMTVHHVIILGKWPTWCTNSLLCIYFYLQLSTCFEHTGLFSEWLLPEAYWNNLSLLMMSTVCSKHLDSCK